MPYVLCIHNINAWKKYYISFLLWILTKALFQTHNSNFILMPGPSTLYRSQNVLCQSNFLWQTTNWIAFSATPKDFALVLQLNLLNINHLLVWHNMQINFALTQKISNAHYDLKSMSCKFWYLHYFWMPRSSYIMSFLKINISLLFRPSASEVLVLYQ